MSKFELLSPAGNFDALKAAVAAGCDAVYCGGNMFGARAFANNFSNDELIEAIDYCHIHGVRLFLTVNTLLKGEEIDSFLLDYIKPLYEAGLDAVIIQDLGVLRFVKAHFPDLELHASTQMTILGSNFAKELKMLGVKRVVTPRELSLSEIKDIYNTTGLDIETFVHGALCYCYSGQCLMSSLIGQRSGNRGKCAQPCRLPYKTDDSETAYYLSPSDLCTLDILPSILEEGVYSLKIEGRMKNPEYVYVVTSIYRKYIDMYEQFGREGYKVDRADFDKLLDIYNRGGFTEGFFNKQNSASIMSIDKPNHQGVKAGIIRKISGNNIFFENSIDLNKNDVLEFRLKNNEYISFTLGNDYKKGSKCTGFLYKKNVKRIEELKDLSIFRTKNSLLIADYTPKKLRINGKIVILKDKNIEFTVFNKDTEITLEFAKADSALKQALNKDTVIKQLCKTGNEDFDFSNLEVELDDGLFLPMGVLNNIRRDALNKFKDEFLKTFKKKSQANAECIPVKEKLPKTDEDIYSALVNNISQLEAVLKFDRVKNVYIEQAFNDYDTLCDMCRMVRNAGKVPFLALAHITRKVFHKDLRNNLKFYLENDYEGYMFRNPETFFMFKAENIDVKKVVFDSSIYTFNNYSYEHYKELGADVVTASYEHNLKDLKQINKALTEVNLYGYIPVMISANCINKTKDKCHTNFQSKSSGFTTTLKDRLSNNLRIVGNCRYCYNIIYNNVPLSSYEELEILKSTGFSKFRLSFTLEDKYETEKILEYYLNNNSLCAPLEYTKGHLKRGV